MARFPDDRTASRPRFLPACFPAALLFLAAVCTFALFAGGCDRSTEPDPGPEFVYTWEPEGSSQALANDQFLDFQINDRTRNDWTVDWLRNGEDCGVGPRYRFYPERYGLDTLVAQIRYPEGDARRRWIVDVVPPEPTGFFHPPDSTLHVIETMSLILHASSNRSRIATYRWLRAGAEVCTDSSYVYRSEAGGTEAVRCEIHIDDTVLAREWTIQSTPLSELDVPQVENLRVERGSQLGRVVFSWSRVDSWYVPIKEYQILASHSGPITAEDPGDAFVLKRIPHEDQIYNYRTDVDVGEEPRLISGEDAWFTVVAVDERGGQSPPTEQLPFLIPLGWYAEGTVRDLDGEPIAGMRVFDSRGQFETWTDETGHYRTGLYSDLQAVTILVEPDPADPVWHPAVSPELRVLERQEHDFVLIPRLGVDPGCPEYNDDFVNFLRRVSMTLYNRTDRPNCLLYRWESFPLRVHVPDYTSPAGADFAGAARSAVRIWDDKLGGGYLELVESADQAQIVFVFGETGLHRFGYAQLLEPGGGSITLGAAIPELVSVTIYDIAGDWESVEIVSLHELGHALGIVGHTVCPDVGYLMYIGPSMFLENWPEHAVHPDELNAIRVLRRLPQASDMELYPLD